MRVLLATAAVTALMWAAAAPVHAIETSEFGVAPAGESHDGKMRVRSSSGGGSSTGQVRVWNKSDRPLTLRLSVLPATVDSTGEASLGGDRGAVEWVRLERSTVRLAPSAQQVVPFEVRSGAHDGRERTVAITVEPELGADDRPAVLQRVGLIAYLRAPSTSPHILPMGVTAAALLLAIIGFSARHNLRRRASA